MGKPDLSIVCPAYYDEDNIGPLVRRCLEVLAPWCAGLEVIVVEDGSPDGTGRAIDELAEKFPRVKALHHEKNMGHGAALKTGFKNSRYSLVAFMDGDGQYEPLDLPGMLSRMEEADIVQGRRTSYPNGWARWQLSRLYNVTIRHFFGAPFNDLGCSIKMLKRDVAEKHLPDCDGIFMQGELVLRAFYAGDRVEEIDVMCYPRATGKSSSLAMKNLLRMIRDFRAFMSRARVLKKA